MEANERVVKPFNNLNELYSEIDSLVCWPGILELRKSTDYVHRGTDVDTQVDRPERLRRDDVPKTIVCHDMMGGYLEDKFIDGSNEHNSYHFYHWNVIDTFIYFSHHFVTIPPFGWINAAHKHGVKVLGTLITESSEGCLLWDEILKTRDSIIRFADALIQLASFYKFEGWLLNVENQIKQNDVTKLTFFVQYLTETIHMKVPGSEVIWYDSVINTGALSWQNELNKSNECFFDRCDGIFLNYTWTDAGLIKSAAGASKRNRMRDIYVGLDVWGRGCPGGGGFNSAHALQRIRNQGLSVAIFAPAWTFEYFGPETFPKLENIFWAQLLPFLYVHVPVYQDERFITTFCRGAGTKYYEYGTQITYQDPETHETIASNSSFYNMSMQKHQTVAACLHLMFTSTKISPPITNNDKTQPKPQECVFETEHEVVKTLGNRVTLEDKTDSYNGKNCIQFSYDLSYEGGGCLKLINNDIKSYHRLLFVSIELPREIQARIIYRSSNKEQLESSFKNDVVLILGNSNGITSFLPRDTMPYGDNWKMSVFQTNMRAAQEVGVAVTSMESCYIGKIVLEESRRPYHL
ncbi:cytosolic endo-beta-N-acetylglucosaminidase [Copidosoma floridanum]|uniref:cytosolic endo-beta-N-acetylglucosaminidase n=1 Tax=Copidosoma floridanum TaxID=29053 RepID=UPI0006C9C695|nr:cytosolic endo-beta-N-acetylglucosaminidase [Copidosoma floridanum]